MLIVPHGVWGVLEKDGAVVESIVVLERDLMVEVVARYAIGNTGD